MSDAEAVQLEDVYVWGDVTQDLVRDAVQDIRRLDSAGPEGQPLVVHFHSDGGDADAGFALYDALRATVRPVYSVGWGIVASAALWGYLAGDLRLAHRHTRMMDHNVTQCGIPPGPEAPDLVRIAGQSAWMDRRMGALWKQVTGRPRRCAHQEVVWFNGGRACVQAGLATGLVTGRRRFRQPE